METRFTESDIQKSLGLVTQNLNENTEKYLREKRSTFQHFTLLIATILGFSSGIALIGGTISFSLKFSWIIQILTIFVGSAVLILESETRYYRSFWATSTMLDVFKDIKDKGGVWDKDSLSYIVGKGIRDLSGLNIDKNKTLREKIFDWFARNIKQVEIIFYALFFLSITSLVISFLVA
jgi:hypothetical protein